MRAHRGAERRRRRPRVAALRFRPSIGRQRSGKCDSQKTPGTPATQRASRRATRRTAPWRNRSEFLTGRNAIVQFLARKWARELDYRLIKELWAVQENRIAVRFAYEWHDDSGQWFRSYGNENWEFDSRGLMVRRLASINDLPIRDGDRKYFWPLGRRPDDHPGLSDLGL